MINFDTKYRLWYVLFTISLLAGCLSQNQRTDVVDDVSVVLEDAVEANKTDEKLPDSVSKALIPTINLSSAKLPKLEDQDKFDLSVNDVPADQFFLSLVDGTPFNMVIHPEVGGTITLNLRNVTVPEVLEAVRDVYGYEFVSTPYGFQVLPGRLQARIYQINYLNVQRTGSSSTLVSSGTLTNRNQRSTSDGENDDTSSSSNQSFGTQIRTEQPETTFWSELQASVSAIVGQGEGRNVVVNPQSGVVVVRALPTELREVETFLRATQLIVQRQVILEAKILEVRLSDGYQTGINWSSLLKPGNNAITASNIGGGSLLVNEAGTSDIAGQVGTINARGNFTQAGVTSQGLQRNIDGAPNPSFPSFIDPAVTSAFGGVFSLALNLGDFTAFIELLETQGNVQVLSSPRVATVNNQKAVIKVGTDEFFVTDISTRNVSTATANTITPDVTLTPFFSGIALDVTPQISEVGDVTLHIHPSISEVVDQQKTVTIGNQVQQLPLALSTVRETDSIVRARSGQVIVIGGLMQNQINDADAAAPGLSKIPGIGNLFKHTKKQSVKSELVILLKPIVIKDDSQWRGALQESADTIKDIKRGLK